MTATHSSVSRSAESEPQAHELESYHERYSAESEAGVAIFARPLRSPETLRRPSQYRTLFQSSKSHPRTDLTELETGFASLPKRFPQPTRQWRHCQSPFAKPRRFLHSPKR